MVTTVLPYLSAAAALGAILAGIHSLYRGTVGELIGNIKRIPHIEVKVDQMEEKQDDMSDAIVMLGHAATQDDIEPDPEALERDLRDDDQGPGRYARDGLYRGGQDSGVEDEHEYPGLKNREQESWSGGGARMPERDEP